MSEKLLLILLSFSSDFTAGLSLTCLSEWEGQNEEIYSISIFFLL